MAMTIQVFFYLKKLKKKKEDLLNFDQIEQGIVNQLSYVRAKIFASNVTKYCFIMEFEKF